ncbi:MAG: hypothetical protein DLM58_16610 [Pseudonocardiales bacterium]|nr:MAG: hypothetical protein DLM58_16610 [Pseudonocardiales bacterium]
MLVAGICVWLTQAASDQGSATRLSRGALPQEVAGSVPPRDPHGQTSAPTARRTNSPGVPVAIDIPIPSPNHPRGVHAAVSANALNSNGSLFVPADPREVSWANQDAAPGSARGTAILTSHINYVINGETVPGAFADLADYASTAVGKQFSVLLADGRRMQYRIVAGREYNKEQLAADPSLRTAVYNQTDSFGPHGQAPTGRLLLASCGGPFDPGTGEYEDNVFLYALPVSGTAGD